LAGRALVNTRRATMRALGLTLEELVDILWTCDCIAFDSSTPPYLQEFIAMKLADSRPELSTRVRGFDGEQMDRLCAYIHDTYQLLRA
jgi:hypothetical protein